MKKMVFVDLRLIFRLFMKYFSLSNYLNYGKKRHLIQSVVILDVGHFSHMGKNRNIMDSGN